MKIVFPILMMIALLLGLAACGGKTEPEPSETPAETTADAAIDTEAADGQDDAAADPADAQQTTGARTLVVVFSATGTTKGVAEKIADLEKPTSMRSKRRRNTPTPTSTGTIPGAAPPLSRTTKAPARKSAANVSRLKVMKKSISAIRSGGAKNPASWIRSWKAMISPASP